MTILFIKQLPFQKIKVKTVLWPEDKTDQNVEFLDLANGMQTETPPADGGLQGSLLSGIGSLSDTHTLEHILLKQQEMYGLFLGLHSLFIDLVLLIRLSIYIQQ